MSKHEFAIEVANLGKCYPIYEKPIDRLKQLIAPPNKKYYRDFWALQDINFSVKKGESLGIIGRNGSGKSTLLQILCQTLTPTKGTVKVQGKIAALLELGAGFNPLFTGRENVFLNGAILGYSRAEMQKRLPDILEFADIGSHIDQPVKTYSSGMFVRLAFAVQACVNPDILIVDEALSVGDVFFQQKCARRMQELRDQGTTLIFVSHDMAIVRDLCETAVYLHKGRMLYFGDSGEAIKKYFVESSPNLEEIDKTQKAPITLAAAQTADITAFKESACWVNTNNDTQKKAQIIAITALDEYGIPSLVTHMTKTLKFKVLYQSLTELPIHAALTLRNRYNHIIHCSGTYSQEIELPPLQPGEFAIFELDVKCMLEAGNYTFSASLAYISDLPNRGHILDESPWAGPLTILWDYERDLAPWTGMFGLPTKARIIAMKNN
jgi:lipopolysaccharide transport system ATP-binding protein